MEATSIHLSDLLDILSPFGVLPYIYRCALSHGICLCFRFLQEEAFFVAQLFFAIAAPLFFSRVLFLAQIDENLGLMVQVLKWS